MSVNDTLTKPAVVYPFLGNTRRFSRLEVFEQGRYIITRQKIISRVIYRLPLILLITPFLIVGLSMILNTNKDVEHYVVGGFMSIVSGCLVFKYLCELLRGRKLVIDKASQSLQFVTGSKIEKTIALSEIEAVYIQNSKTTDEASEKNYTLFIVEKSLSSHQACTSIDESDIISIRDKIQPFLI